MTADGVNDLIQQHLATAHEEILRDVIINLKKSAIFHMNTKIEDTGGIANSTAAFILNEAIFSLERLKKLSYDDRLKIETEYSLTKKYYNSHRKKLRDEHKKKFDK